MGVQEMNWRNDKPTYTQLNYIKELEDCFGVKFTGTTKGEASDFINEVKEKHESEVDYYNWENESRNG